MIVFHAHDGQALLYLDFDSDLDLALSNFANFAVDARGVAHLGEFVDLVREPNNSYDRNAIRVDNLARQQARR